MRTRRWRYDRNIRMDGDRVGVDHARADASLVDVEADPRETRNVASGNPEVVNRLEAALAVAMEGMVEVPPAKRR